MYSTTQVTHVRSHFTDWEEYTTTTTNYWQVAQTLKEEMAQREIDIDISDGLHSLTGGHGSAEVKYREQQLKLFKDDPLIFGLALHAYGDSYAHQDMNNSGRMYPPVIGHAIGLLRPREAKETDGSPMRFADNMHEPDDISNPKPGRAALYQTYVGNLYRIFLETLGTEPRIKPDAVLDALKELTDMQFVHQVNKLDDDGKQRKESGIIREALRKSLKIGPAPYAPEEEKEVYWRQFWPQYADIITKAGGDEQVFGQVRKMGHQWRSDLSFSTRNTSEAETEQHDRMEREIEAAPRPSP
jgi:Trp operon repressor